MITGRRQLHLLYAGLLLAVMMNVGLWLQTRGIKPVWPNVPAPPSRLALSASFLGDEALAYRAWALVLQNLGNSGGDYRPLKDYNYAALGEWFARLDELDPASDFVPFLAAYYFGASDDSRNLKPVVSYLEKVGSRPEGEKWRFLAHAVYLARHKLHDVNEALRLSGKLAALYRPGMPAWTLQTKAMLTAETGDKEAAYMLLKSMLATEARHMQGPEVNYMVETICTRILTPAQAVHDPLCRPAAEGESDGGTLEKR